MSQNTAPAAMKIQESPVLTGSRLSTTETGTITYGIVWTVYGIVDVYCVRSNTPWGHLSAVLNGIEYRVEIADKPSKHALICRAHVMMRRIAQKARQYLA